MARQTKLTWLMKSLLLLALPESALADCGATSRAFANPQAVLIDGYMGDAMEPFITRDGQTLFFNNRNDPASDTNLHYAARLDDLHFRYMGEVRGANSKALDGVASMDGNSTFYFVSTRDYDTTLSTLFHGRFAEGVVVGAAHVKGIAAAARGHVNFDAEISADGETLYYVDGFFSGGDVPNSSEIRMARKAGDGFAPLPESARLMARINTGRRQYAPAISPDGGELFFTRLDTYFLSSKPETFQAVRKDAISPFNAPALIAAIQGFAEAPTLSADGCALYYHTLEASRFLIKRVSRGPAQ
jgi:WD40-like Beta Propeller Repeat